MALAHQRFSRMHGEALPRPELLRRSGPGIVVHQMRGRAVGQERVPFAGGEPEVQGQQDGADAGQGEQQHELAGMIGPQPGHPVARAHAPVVPQLGGQVLAA